jgi:hypothetical protein
VTPATEKFLVVAGFIVLAVVVAGDFAILWLVVGGLMMPR